jgi:hypothetical protein
MFAPLVDFVTGRSSAWKAKYEAAFVTLVNPDTGVPYTASGGGGGGLADLLYIDDTNTVFVYRDTGSGALSAVNVPAGTAYTVGANPRPWNPTTQAVTNTGTFATQATLQTGSNIIGRVSTDLTTYGTTNSVFVGGTSQVQVTPTVTSASAYAASNVVGGLLTFANAVQSTVLSGVITSVSVAVKSTQTAGFKLYLFSASPAGTFTNKTAGAIATADASLLLDVITLGAADSGLGSNVTIYNTDAISRSVVLAGTSLYGVLITTGTPTFTTTTDVVVTVSILKD